MYSIGFQIPPEEEAVLGVGIHTYLGMPVVDIFNKMMGPCMELLQSLVPSGTRVVLEKRPLSDFVCVYDYPNAFLSITIFCLVESGLRGIVTREPR